MLLPSFLLLQICYVYSGDKLKGTTKTLKTDGLPDPNEVSLFTLNITTTNDELREKKILGGKIVPSNNFTFQAALRITFKDQATTLCGGSIISPKYILTAAHCLLRSAETVLAVLGTKDLSKKEAGQRRMYAKSYTYHKKFDNVTLSNDIAVVCLPAPIKYSDTIKSVKLPSSRDAQNQYIDAEVTVVGWGQTSDSSSPAEELRFLKTRVIPVHECSKPCFSKIQITSAMICTSGAGSKGACFGDSGSPLIYNNKQIGIVSFVCSSQCSAGLPTGYTGVTSYLDWIAFNTNTKKNKKSARKKRKKARRTH